MDNYYISFVVATRNDNHGGNIRKKNQFFINKWAYVTAKYNLSCELIVVDWNPIKEKEDLQNTLNYPRLNSNQSIRIIKVPEKFHKKYNSSDQLKFFQMQAKNVGIRRAKGQFILCTNIDIVFSEEMIEYLSKKSLDENKIYRTDRYDIDFDLFDNLNNDTDFFMSYCTGINKKNYSIDLKTNKKYYIYKSITKTTFEVLKDFFFSIINTEKRKRSPFLIRPFEILKDFFFSLINTEKRKRSPFLIRPFLFLNKLILRIPIILINFTTRILFNFVTGFKKIKKFTTQKLLPELHTNACGDFTLASKKIWEDSDGYYEYDGYSFFIDSLFLYYAYYKGYNTTEINHKIFHINHSQGFIAGSNNLFKSLRKRNIPYINFELFLKYINQYKKNKNYIPQKKKWGLKDKILDEFRI